MAHILQPSTVLSQSVLEEEYIVQFLEFSPKSISDGLYNFVYDYINDGMNSLLEVLRTEFATQVSTKELEDGKLKIINNFNKTSERTFDKLEFYILQNVFHVPEDFVFPEDQIHMLVESDEKVSDQLDQEITRLTRKIVNTEHFNKQLIQESLELNVVLTEHKKLHNELQTLEKRLKQKKVSGLEEIKTSCSQSVGIFFAPKSNNVTCENANPENSDNIS